MTLATDGSCLYNGERRAKAGAGVFVEGDQRLNKSYRLPEEITQSNQTGELIAAILATEIPDGRARVIMETDSRTTMDSVTKWTQRHEDSGYILQKNAHLTRVAVAKLRMRHAHTLFKWVRGHSGHPRNEAADKLAAPGAEKTAHDEVGLDIPVCARLTGAKLQSMTQKLAYRAIQDRKDKLVKPRPRTTANVDRITAGIQATFGTQLYDETIWTSFRSRHVSRQAAQFLWMATHDGYMIGSHWLRTNMSAELQERATCRICGECEMMTHIIFDCEARGQAIVWKLLEMTWRLTGAKWYEPCWGTAFGAACAVFSTSDGARKPATESLWCILCTEAVHLIWKLRCERVIQRDGEEFTETEVTNRYYAAMDARLSIDRRTAAIMKGKRALKPQDVERIWQPVIDRAADLPPKWVVNSGVLVGIKRGR
ncbi:ribonuclease H-like protein [Polyporus arcularius HHB13444]|uniref:ribonuclease H n=1 Tax=Polyporus arcularius HHB13444 TaxID=1314778 RepID=A0A5C3NTZ4_9APHY|nr:ribonuclease H-like protein [Polyporus arcularius HHB13444]